MSKRKRLIRRALILWLLSLMVVSPAIAHSGSLDSNGGHWNHSTGTYHYHSGEHTEGSSGSSSGYSYSTGSYYATTGSVNLREGPSTDYRIITTLNPGVRVKYISSTQGWYRVNYNGQIGYVSGNYLEPTSAPVFYNKSVVSKSAVKAATPKPTAKPASGSSKSASGKKELLPMTIGNIIFIFCAGLGLGLIILWIYAHKVGCREASMRIEAANRETNAFKRGGEAAETRLKLKEQELAKRENDLMKQYFDISDSIEESRRELEEIQMSLPSSECITPVKIANNQSVRTLYHRDDSYCIYSDLSISLHKAEQMGLKPCPKCKPMKYKIIYPSISAPPPLHPGKHPD